jgi:hypothetical protein
MIPEISWIVSVLARYMTKAGELHMAASKKGLRYLQSRKKIPLQWCAIDNALPGIIHGYADASFGDIPDTRLSSIGYVFLVNGGAISLRSTKTRPAGTKRRRSRYRQPQLGSTRMSLSSQTLYRNVLSPAPPDYYLRRLQSSCCSLSRNTLQEVLKAHCPPLALYRRTSGPSGR